ncbi:hypothetical protein J2Z60_001825 [Lactobacillus colini]|uniref:Uncharacterized protein n=1 Tax=Lactobacillus colini TaxID=1819254 RepID=A0ABS4MH46_9LACO|nr:hypothetical protein [Lactobacillus colini]MBP2058637.1 hypothetical protein [Lactobacillus colini]
MNDKNKNMEEKPKTVLRNDSFDWSIPVPRNVAKKNKMKAKKEEAKNDLKDN